MKISNQDCLNKRIIIKLWLVIKLCSLKENLKPMIILLAFWEYKFEKCIKTGIFNRYIK